MKNLLMFSIVLFLASGSSELLVAQTVKVPSSCKMYLEDKMIAEVTVEDAIKWCELTPPTVQCDDGKIYKLETFAISYLTLKPFMSQDFGVGLGGFPIRAREAVKNGKSGDTIILKEVTYTDSTGTKKNLPVISLKFK
jgi:hypothetical protein